MKHHLMKVLYVQFKSFGDVVVSTIILRALRKKFPDARIDYYTTAVCSELLVGNPILTNVFTERRPPKMDEYDITFRPYHCLQSSGGWHLSGKHFVELYAEACGVEIDNPKPDFYMVGKASEGTKENLKNVVLLQCKTNDSAKDWSMENWEALAFRIRELGLRPIQIGGRNDPKIANASSWLNGCTWINTANYMKNVLTTICLDSVVQHLAAAIDAPFIALYGAKESTLVATGVFNKGQHCINPVDRNGCPKACYLANCLKEKKCIDNIDPLIVENLIKEYLR